MGVGWGGVWRVTRVNDFAMYYEKWYFMIMNCILLFCSVLHTESSKLFFTMFLLPYICVQFSHWLWYMIWIEPLLNWIVMSWILCSFWTMNYDKSKLILKIWMGIHVHSNPPLHRSFYRELKGEVHKQGKLMPSSLQADCWKSKVHCSVLFETLTMRNS